MSTPSPADVASVRALAHPLRLELLDLLRFDGPSTATRLAGRVGESSGATSYHLRQLARHGYIEEAEQHGGRERWWRYREREPMVPEDEAGSRRLLAELLSREAHALDRYLAGRRRALQSDDASFFQSRALRLTPGELDLLGREIDALLRRLRRADADDAPAEAVPVRILAFGFPAPREEA